MVEDLVQFVGYGALKLITLGSYESEDGDGIFIEGCVGLLLLGTLFFVLGRFVL